MQKCAELELFPPCVRTLRRGTLFSDEHMREKAQGYIMLYEMLLGKGSIQGGGKLKVVGPRPTLVDSSLVGTSRQLAR